MTSKSFSGAPFGYQSHRFDLAGVHPKRKMPGTLIGMQTSSNNNIGPGYYITEDRSSSFSQSKLDLDAKKPGWKRSYATEQFSSMPYILNKDLYLAKQEQKRKLGPGYYSVDYSTLNLNKNVKGVMSEREPRFMEEYKEITPGPGIYGKCGIPHLLKEEGDNQRKSASTIGMLHNGGNGERTLPATGCRLAPNTYNLPSFINEVINHQSGKRGPYDIFSLNRTKPIKTGHLAVLPAHELAPGHYDSKSSVDILNSSNYKHHGKFLKMDQYPDKPHDRAYWNNPACVPPDINNQLAPGSYDVKFPQNIISHDSAPPFNSSSNRHDKLSNMFFYQNFNQVGPGRYDLQRLQDSKYVNSHENIFKSKTGAQLTKEKFSMLSERLKPKNIPINKRHFIDHIPTESSPCVDLDKMLSHNQIPLTIS